MLGLYLSLLADQVNLGFLGTRFFLLSLVLQGLLAFQEVQQALGVLGCCCGTLRWESGSVTC